MSMKPSIDKVIAYEIKREIAERYFGFRKLIEEDKISLSEHIRQHTFILEKRISFDLIRIYILLKEEQVIHAFLELTGIEEELFYDPYLSESQVIKQRVFEGIRFRGLTQKGSFHNAVLDCYERLEVNIDHYRSKFEELVADQEMISEEIKIFYQQNDLGSILNFLRSLGDQNLSGNMHGGMEPGIARDLEKKLHIPPPSPVEQFLPIIPPLVPLKVINSDLKKIITQAFMLQDQDIRAYLENRESWFR